MKKIQSEGTAANQGPFYLRNKNTSFEAREDRRIGDFYLPASFQTNNGGEHHFTAAQHVGLVSTILDTFLGLGLEEFKHHGPPNCGSIGWEAVDEALNKAASECVEHLPEPHTQVTIISRPEHPARFPKACFRFRTESGFHCYPNIYSKELLPNSEGILNISELLRNRLSSHQHHITPAATFATENLHLVQDPRTGESILTISHKVAPCQGATCQLNDDQMSGLVQYIEKALGVSSDECKVMSAEGKIPEKLASRILQLEAQYLRSCKITCADIRSNFVNSSRMTAIHILGLQEVSKQRSGNEAFGLVR